MAPTPTDISCDILPLTMAPTPTDITSYRYLTTHYGPDSYRHQLPEAVLAFTDEHGDENEEDNLRQHGQGHHYLDGQEPGCKIKPKTTR